MAYSSIARKKCKCGNCNRYPTISCQGYNYACAPQEIKDKLGDRRKVNEKNKRIRVSIATQAHKDQKEVNDEGLTEKEQWFRERRKEMTGRCLFCGGKTEKNNEKTFRSSIAHLFAKKDNFGGFPSIATNKDNWLELCYYGNSCHDNFDRHMITWELLRDSAEWVLIVDKFKKIYPHILESEKRNIPELLLKEL